MKTRGPNVHACYPGLEIADLRDLALRLLIPVLMLFSMLLVDYIPLSSLNRA